MQAAEMLPETNNKDRATQEVEFEVPSLESPSVAAASGTRPRVTPPPRKTRSSAERRVEPAVAASLDLGGFFGVNLPPENEAAANQHTKAAPPPPPRPSTMRREGSVQPVPRASQELRGVSEQPELPEAPPTLQQRRRDVSAMPPPKPSVSQSTQAVPKARSVGPGLPPPSKAPAKPNPTSGNPAPARTRSSIPPP